jgi:6-phosphogluconolactonase
MIVRNGTVTAVPTMKTQYAYVGSRTSRERNARGDGISVYKFAPAMGTLECVQRLGGLVNPSYLTVNRAGDRLYCVHGDQEEVSVLRIDLQSGQLQYLATQHCGGKNPVHLALDPSEQFLMVSNHWSGSVAVLPVLSDGALGRVSQTVNMVGTPGPHRVEQAFAKPHFNLFDPSGQFVMVPDKGFDRVFTFRFEGGQLTPANQPWVDTHEGAGPRHIVFHAEKPWAYVVNELDSSVTVFNCDWQTGGFTGGLTAVQRLSALPDTYCANSRAAGISLAPNGRTLYVSNRGHDSVAALRVAPETGRLTFLDASPTLGRIPRFFTFSPSGDFLFVLNEDSDSIVSFAVDAQTGRLNPTGLSWACGSPVCMVWGVPVTGSGSV